jgi:hypothetical protein
MSVTRTLVRFLALTAIGHELTYSLGEAEGLDATRQQLTGFVVGFALAGIYRPNLLADVEGRRMSTARRVANLAADAALIGLGTRWWHQLLGELQREWQSSRQRHDVEPDQRIEIERAMLPGISIRS